MVLGMEADDENISILNIPINFQLQRIIQLDSMDIDFNVDFNLVLCS